MIDGKITEFVDQLFYGQELTNSYRTPSQWRGFYYQSAQTRHFSVIHLWKDFRKEGECWIWKNNLIGFSNICISIFTISTWRKIWHRKPSFGFLEAERIGMKTGSCSICIRLHEIYAVNITGIKRYHTTWMKKRILQGAGDDEPASSGNESCGIPCLPVVLYREMDLDVGRVSIAVHYMDQGLGSTVICILSSAYFAVAPALFSQLYEERLTVF